ncbi:xylulokinase [Alicyclobacillus sp. ALC3]|uniref:xylulokinase n=1 Tax=Alicyclobacillus sp. ALC3 TaxID=2796143 RepID=UPI0023787F4F|nr:xylulokinase [Alicyclobacillus sp. ALC3]WDL95361.1 xylulokinase [Alicyclobacillus sp. ALC3]
MDRQRVVLGIDVGTSGTKVIAVRLDGTIVSVATASYEMMTPKSGYAEQHPEDWWSATVSAIQTVMTQAGDVSVAGIGLSGQMHGLVPLDKQGRVIRPSIIWCDLRSDAEALELERAVGRDTVIRLTENPPLPNFTITKILWMKHHEPDLYSRIDKVLLPKDYVRYRLTDSFAMDVSDASGTLMLDVAKRAWSKEMCEAAGIPLEWLPPVYESNEVVGHLSATAARLLGLPEGVPVVAGAGDQAAGAIGLGIVEPGTVSAVFGTSGVVLAVTDKSLRDPAGRLHTFCHAQRDSWFVMGVTQAAGGSLQWYRNRLAQMEQAVAARCDADIYTLLMNEAETVAPGADGLLFLPYLMGERSPHLDPQARGAWIGLEWRHTAAHLVRAILEGVSFSLRDCWEAMQELGVTSSGWKASGGGASGRLWMEVFASVIGEPVQILQSSHGPALGAAILAAQGIGALSEDPAAIQAWLGTGNSIPPRADWADFYNDLYPLFQEGYRVTKNLMHDLNGLAGRLQA